MNWESLQDNKCPNCDHRLDETPDGEYMRCINTNCSFRISVKRLDEILNNMSERDIRASMEGFDFNDTL